MNIFGPYPLSNAKGDHYKATVFVDPHAIALWLARNAVSNGKPAARALGGAVLVEVEKVAETTP